MSFKLYSTFREAKSEKESYDYSCVLVKIPEETSKILDKYNNENISDDCINGKREDEYHITILFGIEDEDSEETIELLKSKLNTSTFKVRLGVVSKFYQDDKDVLKVDIDDYTGKLEQAFQLINDNIENQNKYEKYHPHCTLAYVNKGACEHLIGDDYFEGMEVTLSELKFSSSEESNTIFTTFGKKNEEIEVNQYDSSSVFDYVYKFSIGEKGYLEAVFVTDKIYKINQVFVEKDFRHQGIATYLYKYAKDYLKDKGIDLIHSGVRTYDGEAWKNTLSFRKKKSDNYQTLETKRRLEGFGDEEEQQSWIDEFHANPKNYQDNIFYRISRPVSEYPRGIGVGKGLYLSKDKRAVENFYNNEGDGELQTFEGDPKILDLTSYKDFENFENEAKEKYDTNENEHFKKLTLEKGYDGVRYYDPMSTGDEYVFYNTRRLKRVGKISKKVLTEFRKLGIGSFNTSKTGVPYYDNMLENSEYFKKEKRIIYSIEYMSPDEYISRASKLANTDVESWIDLVIPNKVQELKSLLEKGTIINMPLIDYRSLGKGQEGRHRALAAKLVGIDSIPVMIIKDAKKISSLIKERYIRDLGSEELYPKVTLLSTLPKPWTIKRETEDGDVIFEIGSDSDEEMKEDFFNDPYNMFPSEGQVDTYRGVQTEDNLFNSNGELMGSFHTTIHCIEPIVKYLLNQNWKLEDAILIGANLCEDCLNICLEELDGRSYEPEQYCNTSCNYCEVLK